MKAFCTRQPPFTLLCGLACLPLLVVGCWPRRTPPLRIGTNHSPPYQVVRPDGTVTGFAVETVNEAARRVGVRLQWVVVDGLPEEAFAAGRIDLWPLLTETQDRRKLFHMTLPWWRNDAALVYPAGAGIRSLADLPGRRLARPRIRGVRLTDMPLPAGIHEVLTPSGEASLQAVCRGDADVAWVNLRVMPQLALLRPAGCEQARLEFLLPEGVTLQFGMGATFAHAKTADRLASEIVQMAAEGWLARAAGRWLLVGGGEGAYQQSLDWNRERSVWLLAGLIGAGMCLALCLWLVARLRRNRSDLARLAVALAREQERWRLVQAANNDGIFDADLAGGMVFYSARWKEMLGYGQDELDDADDAWRERIHPDDNARVQQALVDYLARRAGTYRVEYRLRHRDGSWHWVLARGQALWNPDGQAVRLVGSHSDITAQKRTEAALRTSEARFAAFMDRSPAVAFMKDEDGRMLYVNRTFERLFGRRAQELIGRDDAELWPAEVARQLRENDRRVLATGEPMDLVETVPTPDGAAERWLTLKFSFLDEAGRRTLGGVAIDITGRERAEAALRDAETRYRELIQQASEIIYQTDTNGRVLFYNPAGQRLFGYAEAKLTGRRYTDFIEPGHRRRVERFYEVQFARQTAETYREVPVVTHRGEVRWLAQNAQLVREQGRITGFRVVARDVTDRRAAEARLKASEARYRELFEHNPLPAWIYDSDTLRILDVNHVACEQYGHTQEEFLALTIRDLRPTEEQEALTRSLASLKDRHQRSGPWRHRRKDGSVLLVEIISHEIELQGHRARLVMVNDVTEREAAQERFRLLFEYAADAHFLFGPPGLVDCNPGALAMLGASRREELLGLRAVDLSPEFQPDGARSSEKSKWMADLARLRGMHRFDWVHRRLDGTEFPVEVTATPVRLAGEPAMLVSWHDLTERKRHEDDLRRAHDELERRVAERTGELAASMERYRFLADAVPQIVWTARADGGLDYCNQRCCDYTGRSMEELLEWGWRIVLHPDDVPRTVERWASSLATGEPLNSEFRMQRAGDNAYRWHLCRALPLRDPEQGVVHWVGSCTDIDDQKRAEAVLQRAHEELEVQVAARTAELRAANGALAAAKEAAEAGARAKSEFLAVMSHEIRTPMNGVIGMTSLLRDTPLSGQQRDFVETIRRSGEALLAIINDVLDFSKIEAGRLELERTDFNLHALVEESLDLVAEAARRKGLALHAVIDTPVPAGFWGDPGRLRQVLLNYLSNAVKFTERGEVVVRVGWESGPGSGLVRFAVSDTGMGIAPEVQLRLFASFTQADASTTRQHGGTGLGLAIAKRLAEMMGGTVGLDSALGQGSTFWFTAWLAPSGTPHTHHGLALAGKRALVVEDSDAGRQALALQLRRAGLEADAVASGAEALSALRTAAYDVALLGFISKDGGGLTLAREVRSKLELAALPLLLVSPAHQDVRDSRAVGVAECLSWPVRSSTLESALRRALALPDEAPAGPAPAAPDVRAGARILLAEDNPTNQKVGRLMLERLGCHVEIAASGLAAVDAARRAEYDIILMDCQMPGMDGYAATQAIREGESRKRRVPIVALTANALNGQRERCLEVGMDDYLAKPIRADLLSEMLRRWLPEPESSVGDASSAPPLFSPTDEVTRHLADLQRQGVEGDEVRELAQLFLDTTPSQMGQLRAALTKGDHTAAARAAHLLRGSLGCVGLGQLEGAVQSLEQHCRERTLSDAHELLATVLTHYELGCEAIRRWMKAEPVVAGRR